MARYVEGLFDVALTPQPGPGGPDTGLGRLALDKRYHGDLDAVGVGEMLSATTPVRDSAGYVAMERVTGTLQGRRGSFALQHSGTMNRGTSTLSITVVPDSGTDGLEGISGTMTITIDGPKHLYGFDYALPGGGT